MVSQSASCLLPWRQSSHSISGSVLAILMVLLPCIGLQSIVSRGLWLVCNGTVVFPRMYSQYFCVLKTIASISSVNWCPVDFWISEFPGRIGYWPSLLKYDSTNCILPYWRRISLSPLFGHHNRQEPSCSRLTRGLHSTYSWAFEMKLFMTCPSRNLYPSLSAVAFWLLLALEGNYPDNELIQESTHILLCFRRWHVLHSSHFFWV